MLLAGFSSTRHWGVAGQQFKTIYHMKRKRISGYENVIM
jgi:hypothetical protein